MFINLRGGEYVLKKICGQIIFLCGLSLVLSLTYNAVNPRGISWGTPASSAEQETKDFPQVSLAEVYKIYQRPEVVLLDARSAVEYNYGHIAGALNLPLDEFDKIYPLLAPKLTAKKEIIIYCSGAGCGQSQHLAQKLKEKGYHDLKVFAGGWPAWLQAGYPTAK